MPPTRHATYLEGGSVARGAPKKLSRSAACTEGTRLACGGRRPREAATPGEVIPVRYHHGMAMTLRLTEDEQTALRERAAAKGISMQEAARQAVRDYITRGQHRDRVSAAAKRVMDAHAEALERLGR